MGSQIRSVQQVNHRQISNSYCSVFWLLTQSGIWLICCTEVPWTIWRDCSFHPNPVQYVKNAVECAWLHLILLLFNILCILCACFRLLYLSFAFSFSFALILCYGEELAVNIEGLLKCEQIRMCKMSWDAREFREYHVSFSMWKVHSRSLSTFTAWLSATVANDPADQYPWY